MDDVGLDIDTLDIEEEDPEKAAFLSEIDAINIAEESGNLDDVTVAEERLQQQLEEEPEEA